MTQTMQSNSFDYKPISKRRNINMSKRGLMGISTSKTTTPILDQIRAEFAPKPGRTLEEQLAVLSQDQLKSLMSNVRMLAMVYDPSSRRTYSQHVHKLYPKMPDRRKYLISGLMKELEPEAEYKPEPGLTPTNYTSTVLDSIKKQVSPAMQSSPPPYKQKSDFMSKLIQSESSGDTEAEITIADGRKFTGALQFGAARLADYKQSSGRRFTQDEFKADTVLQDEVAQWHIADIDLAIDALGDTAKGFDRDGLRSVAHLGGLGGMAQYVKSGGEYNPSDELGTSLSDYYNKFSS